MNCIVMSGLCCDSLRCWALCRASCWRWVESESKVKQQRNFFYKVCCWNWGQALCSPRASQSLDQGGPAPLTPFSQDGKAKST